MTNIELAKNYGRIIFDPKTGPELIKLFPYQEDILNNFENNSRNMFIHSRQMGLSTMIAIHIARFLIYNKDDKKVICLKSHKIPAATDILYKVRLILDDFYSGEFKDYAFINNKEHINLYGNEVKVINDWSSTNSISNNIHSLIVDNFCYINGISNLVEFFEKNTSCKKFILVSAYQYSFDLAKLKSKFIETKINPNLHPNRNQDWYNRMESLLGTENYNKEINLNGL